MAGITCSIVTDNRIVRRVPGIVNERVGEFSIKQQALASLVWPLTPDCFKCSIRCWSEKSVLFF